MPVQNAEHILVVGNTGSGKTTLVKKIILPQRCHKGGRLIVVDPEAEYEAGIDVEVVAHNQAELDDALRGIRPQDPFSIAYVPELGKEDEAVDTCALYAWHLEDVWFVVEEAQASLRQHVVSPNAVRLARRGRKRGIRFVAVGQRYTDISSDIRSEMDGTEAWFFRCAGRNDRRALRAEVGRRVSSYMATQPNLHAVRIVPGVPYMERWELKFMGANDATAIQGDNLMYEDDAA